jgi:P-type E1-E2 ATPase
MMYYNKKMLEIQLPGKPVIQLIYLLCDINGTLTFEGKLIDGVADSINELKKKLTIHLLSADTNGNAAEIAHQLGVNLHVIKPGRGAIQKERYLRTLSARQTVAVGQGANDVLMLKRAALGICVLSREGSAVRTLNAADIVVPDILTAFELLQNPIRIVATLRQ